MSEEESINSSQPKKDSFYRGTASSVLSHMYDKTRNIAEQHSGKNRGVASGAAASVIGIGLEKISREKLSEELSEEMWDESVSSRGSSGSYMDDHSGHFVDRLLEKLFQHAIPTDSPQKDDMLRRMRDPDRARKPNLSIKILASNFKRLSSRMSGFFTFQYGIIHVLTWRKPTKTISFLVAYTCVCIWPHLVLAYPLIFLLFGIIIPGYLYSHPMQNPELIEVKKRGQSLLSFFSNSDDVSIIDDLLDEDYGHDSDTESIRPISSKSSESQGHVFGQKPVPAEKLAERVEQVDTKKKDKARYLKSQMALLMNMRDLQNLTSDMLVIFDKAEVFWYDTAGFKDERLSTTICYLVTIAIFIVFFFGQYIPWRLIFIQSGWFGFILCHPNSKKYILGMNNSQAKPRDVKKKDAVAEAQEKAPKERSNIIVDESPEVRTVEVYELQAKSLTGNVWNFECYSNDIFSLKDSTRLAQRKPDGTDHLSKIMPPVEWKFDLEYKNDWKIDTSPQEFLGLRFSVPHIFTVEENETEGWIYDNASNYDSDTTFQFRRRRLTRECYRYSRPVRRLSKI